MKKYMIQERVNHYHEVIIDDEIDIESLISKASLIQQQFDTGYEAIEDILKRYEDKYGFLYEVNPNTCGTEVIDIEAIDIID